MQYRFPPGLRPATVEDREQFYRDQFTFDQAEDVLARWDDPTFVVDVGTETTRYRPKYKKYKDKLVYIRNYANRRGLRQKLVRYAPEDLYYVRESDTGTEQEFCIDIDPENADCRACTHFRAQHQGKPKVYSFCTKCFKTAAEQTKQLFDLLETHFHDVRVLYTGRGFHLRVLDDEAYLMEQEDRERFAAQLQGEEYAVDAWVVNGSVDILRVPGSLHGLVSRITTEINADQLDNPEKILGTVGVPAFLDQ
jgi:DNA primase catalytic subunit